MRRIVLMRHAEAAWDESLEQDLDRPLTPRGVRDAERMARWLRGQGTVPARVVSSPARRARETTVAACQGLGLAYAAVVWAEELYGASASAIEDVARKHALGASPLLVVGHNPGLDDLVGDLVGEAAMAAGGKLFTAGTVAILEVPDEGPWAGRGRLVALGRPSDPPGRM